MTGILVFLQPFPIGVVGLPYRLLIEIEQPSLVFSVEVDNAVPRTFQLLDCVRSPKH